MRQASIANGGCQRQVPERMCGRGRFVVHDAETVAHDRSAPAQHDAGMERADAEAFVRRWVTQWNDHDLEGLLAHFGEDVVFTSPVAARLVPESGGVVRGKDALRAYWTRGLAAIPDLRFEVIDSYVGVNTLVIHYRNQRGGLVNEVLVFEGSLVVEGHGTYLD
jgi:ketosteroid isomerase-like protein